MFYDKFVSLCKEKGVAPTRAALDIGLSKSAPIKWRTTGATPNGETLNKIAEYFSVSVSVLLGEETKKAPDLTEKDERDIGRRLMAMIEDLNGPIGGLSFDGEPIDDETRQLLEVSLRNQLEISKRIAKQKFTPKKYRKEGE